MLKSLSKKNLYVLIGLLSFPIFLIILLMILKGCSGGTQSYKSYENSMINSAKKYFENKNLLPKNEGGEVTVSLDDLVGEGYISSSLKKLKDDSCTGSVTVKNHGASLKENHGGFYSYIPNLVCDDYKSVHLIDKLKEGIVTEKSGLYEVGDELIYKGAKVNNYVSFFDKTYRIISIDSNGIMKLIKDSPEKETAVWDYKYNVEVENSFGKNDFSDSNIIEVLKDLYLSTSDKQKKHLIAYSVCYGNRSENYSGIDKSNECSKIIDNQFISMISTYDFARASYDPQCNVINAGSCHNYNYLFDFLRTTWTVNGDADSTYKVYYYSQGYIFLTRANNAKKFNIVIYLDANELYTKGDGSLENPYVIKN